MSAERRLNNRQQGAPEVNPENNRSEDRHKV
jgi:hypothetical protein